ncbi:MAG: hypothetical protein KDA69_09265 [Planctomycetaceae bacterium]|nr:hypothetical protein [Planctomycetaceae bacterium]
MSHFHRALLLLALFLGLSSGCAMNRASVAMNEPQIERGRPNALVDGAGWVVGIPQKVMLWNSRVDNHNVSQRTEQMVKGYLDEHDLAETKVRINQYAPLDEWRRLCGNSEVGIGWRCTFGALHTLGYTVLPGRVFGGDSYNPYTNTLSIYSDVPSLGVVEAAYAQDVRSRNYPGTYAFTQEIAPFSLWHDTTALGDAENYIARQGRPEEHIEAVQVLYPRYGMKAGYAVDSLVGGGSVGSIGLLGLLTGHAVGRHRGGNLRVDALNTEFATTSQQPPATRSPVPPAPHISDSLVEQASFEMPAQ